MDKDTIARMCAAAGLSPEVREKLRGYDLFIADGFSMIPEVHYRRFGVVKGDFPNGAYVTLYFLAKGEDKFDVGVPLLFDAFHNPEFGGDLVTKKRARINTARLEAEGFVKARERVRRNGRLH